MEQNSYTTNYRDTQAFEDRLIPCAHCHEQFVWTAGEHSFYAEKGFTNPPRTCRGQRRVRKEQRERGGWSAEGHPDHCPFGESAGSEGGERSYNDERSYAGGGGRSHGESRSFGGGGRSFHPRQQSSVQVESGIAMRGIVLRVLRDRDFGFLGDSDGVEYYFHRSAAYSFDALFEGAAVSFETENNPRGPRARRVELA